MRKMTAIRGCGGGCRLAIGPVPHSPDRSFGLTGDPGGRRRERHLRVASTSRDQRPRDRTVWHGRTRDQPPGPHPPGPGRGPRHGRHDRGTLRGARRAPRPDVHPGRPPRGHRRGEAGPRRDRPTSCGSAPRRRWSSRTSCATPTAPSTSATTAPTPACRSSAATSSSRSARAARCRSTRASRDRDHRARARTPRSPATTAQGGRRQAHRPRRPAPPRRVKVVYAAQHKPVLAWQTVVTGTEKDGTPIRDLVYTDAKSGKQLAPPPAGHGRHRLRRSRSTAARSRCRPR